MLEEKIVLQAKGITKSFPGVKALSNVSFDLREGEVHILLGENGAGKSTLMKIISGLYSIDEGELYVFGQRVVENNTQKSQELGVSIIYQEFNLIPDLTVAQNIFLGREPLRKDGSIDKALMAKKSAELMDFLQAGVGPGDVVRSLGVAQQQLVEVAKALSQNAKILIMDEPTAALSEKEIECLFETIRTLKEQKVSIIYISHRLQEIKQIGDRTTVLRDGQTIATMDVAETDLDTMIHMMVGRQVSQLRARPENTARDEMMLEVKHLCLGKTLKDISLQVRKGEIVAIAGLVGAGRTELMHAIFGIDRIDSGEIWVEGKRMDRPTPRKSIQSRIGLLPESRKEFGLSLILPISQNITQAALRKIAPAGIMSLGREREAADRSIKELNIVCPSHKQIVLNLSGGNQQKVVLGKWLFTESDLLIFDEPTRGIDVGAREEIYNIMHQLASQGVSILVVSSDLPEILTVADRIYVMREGEIVAEIPYEEASQELVIGYASGGKSK